MILRCSTQLLRLSQLPRRCVSANAASRSPLPSNTNVTSARAFVSSTAETVTVPTQSNGSITLDIYHPLTPPSATTTTTSLILHLPRGPLHPSHTANTSTLSVLRSISPFPIISLNYRQAPYPLPIHDVLAGYDWVVTHLLPRLSTARGAGKLAVVGELVGGSLAAMLALTECRKNEPGVVACAVNNAVVDWISLAQATPSPSLSRAKGKGQKSRRNAGSNEAGRTALIESAMGLRRALFASPRDYFDPFASPVLFFRTPGLETPAPPRMPAGDDTGGDLDELSRLSRADFFREQMGLAGLSPASPSPSSSSSSSSSSSPPMGPWDRRDATESETTATPPTVLGAKRKSSLTYPPRASPLRLGRFRTSVSETLGLRSQAEEFTKFLRRSVGRQIEQGRGVPSFGRKVLEEGEEEDAEGDEAERRAELEAEVRGRVGLEVVGSGKGDLGLWDESDEGRRRVRGVGEWVTRVLGG